MRMSDWSADVFSSDLQRHCARVETHVDFQIGNTLGEHVHQILAAAQSHPLRRVAARARLGGFAEWPGFLAAAPDQAIVGARFDDTGRGERVLVEHALSDQPFEMREAVVAITAALGGVGIRPAGHAKIYVESSAETRLGKEYLGRWRSWW